MYIPIHSIIPRRNTPSSNLMGGSGELPSNWMYDGRMNFIMDNLLAEGTWRHLLYYGFLPKLWKK